MSQTLQPHRQVSTQTPVGYPIPLKPPDEYLTTPLPETLDVKAQAVAALYQLQTTTTDWKVRLRNFGLSLVAFAMVGGFLALVLKSSSATSLLILMLVLFVHEAGHFLGMRLFGYRNLKMFFIPLFGAAVSGYACVPVVKESIVYLLGPLPGILIGYGCGLVYFTTKIDVWRELAVMFVVINALNLAPLYPLDGGRFVFGLLPQRTYRIQWVLQLIFAGLLLAISFGLHIYGLGGLTGFAFGGVLHLVKTNQLARRLRLSPIAQLDGDVDSIPAAAAGDLIDIVRTEYASSKPKAVAEMAWQAWTRVKAPRPQAYETYCLATIYVLTLLSVWVAQSIYAANVPLPGLH